MFHTLKSSSPQGLYMHARIAREG